MVIGSAGYVNVTVERLSYPPPLDGLTLVGTSRTAGLTPLLLPNRTIMVDNRTSVT